MNLAATILLNFLSVVSQHWGWNCQPGDAASRLEQVEPSEGSLKPRTSPCGSFCTGRAGWNSELESNMPEENKDIKTAFKTVVEARLKARPNQWKGEDSVEVVRSLITSLKDDDKKPVTLTDAEKDVIEVIIRPTGEMKARVIQRIIESHNAKYDADTKARIERLLNPMAFRDELVKAGKIVETATSGLKDLLD